MLETIYKVSVCALIAMVFIVFEVETWPLKRVLFKKVFNRKTKTEKPLRVLIITKFIHTADDLFEWLSVAYKKRAVFSLGLFQRKIKFQNKECWYINAYFEDELKSFDLNTFDKIVIGSDVPEDFVKRFAAKVKDRSVIRVCDLKVAINKIGGY